MGFYLTNGHLPFSEPCLGREEWEAVERVFRRNWYTTGPETGEFEREFREYWVVDARWRSIRRRRPSMWPF